MKRFECPRCGQPLHFEASVCDSCAARLGYDAQTRRFVALNQSTRDCFNARFGSCNWLLAPQSQEEFCTACRHNRVVPDLSAPDNLARWRKIEQAKHRLFYNLMRLGLPLQNRIDNPEHGLAFDFLQDTPDSPPVMTGHAGGLITINLAEADDPTREARRTALGEPYRTLLGHFRHEVGHHFWDVLATNNLESFRAIFGDERADYGAALAAHYANGAPPDWAERFISAYAAAHPWEDFAETWAHYLHMIDTLETAAAFGLSIRSAKIDTAITFDPYAPIALDRLIEAWLPLTYAMNAINRSMGQPDLYPFGLTPAVVTKLGFIHELIRGPDVQRHTGLRAMISSLRRSAPAP